MPEKDWLLTDEFFEFSKKISEIYEHKKKKKEELKNFFEKIQLEIKVYEEEASQLSLRFEEWKASYLNLGSFPSAPITKPASSESIVSPAELTNKK